MRFNRLKKFFLLIILGGVFLSFGSGCIVAETMWNSIKDRYTPYECVGAEGDKVLVKFVFDSPSSGAVWLAGQFNGWRADVNAPRYPQVPVDQGVIAMHIDEKTGYWTITIPLSPGRYQYKMVLDEGRVWEPDANTEQTDDNYGGKNSIIIVIPCVD